MKLLEKVKQNVKDKYELTKSVKLVDVKGYLQKEYDRASIREKEIRKLEKQVEDMQELQLKYDAMLVVQEKTQKRIEELDDRILEYRATLKEKNEEIKLLKSKSIDLKINAENKLKEKDNEIKELKKQIKKASKKTGGK